ncbi:hypothetical protein [Deinococcus roseus]|uniref:DUF11 domain-containing protein n=1 Tax=Deinococcus roseus TaxID=392414 RepID=A0ABQ2DFS1_9DEIO|nr:hypothetical protein [Deinococcus roseus]GGJ54235.1 hypothetical protein GCM10008938_45400 [Deinococcus roseus]
MKALTALWVVPVLLISATTSALVVKSSTYLVTTQTKDGKVQENRKLNPTSVKPKDLLVLTTAVQNVTQKALSNVSIVQPIPEQTQYLANSATQLDSAQLQYSADGGKTFAKEPLKKTVLVEENGKKIEKEVTIAPQQYTHVKWVLKSIQPEASQTLEVRVNVR